MRDEGLKYRNFDELSADLKDRFRCEVRGCNLEQSKDGYMNFINLLNQRKDELVGIYTGKSVKTQIKFSECGHVTDISPNSYKSGHGCGVCSGQQVQRGVNDLATLYPHLAKEWHPTKNSELAPHNVSQGSGKKVWWKCSKGHEWEASIYSRTRGDGCPYCSNHRVLKGYNDIATTHPQYVKYFANIEDTYTNMCSSNKKVKIKCPECGHIKAMVVNNLTRRGFSCDLCSDGISYPEKLMASILTKLNIEFIKQMSYNNGEHRYDFYLPQYNTILETHGIQHYEQSPRGRSLEEEQKNDEYKRELAINNGVLNENYHEVDCRYSTLEWCRPNIEKALSSYVNTFILTDEDWKEVDIQAQKSLKIEVCKYWKENKDVNDSLTPQQIADVFGVDKATVRNYLNWGNANGFCNYDGEEEKKASVKRRSTFIYLIKPNGDKWFDEPMNMSELSRQTGISLPAIKNNLDEGALRHYSYSKYNPKYIGSYIVSEDKWNELNK